jgi:hypothetical protein
VTHYEVLGVGPAATAEEIKRAYRRQARLHHPDVAEADARGMRALNEAWAVLGNPDRRRAYDRAMGTSEPVRPAPPASEAPQAGPWADADEDDEPFLPEEPREARREMLVFAPVVVLAMAVGFFALSTLMFSPALQTLAIVLLPVAGLCFALVPIITLRRQARRTYR